MNAFANLADLKAIEAELPWAERDEARSMYEFLTRAKDAHGGRPAIISYATHARLNTSLGGPTSASPVTCSGLI